MRLCPRSLQHRMGLHPRSELSSRDCRRGGSCSSWRPSSVSSPPGCLRRPLIPYGRARRPNLTISRFTVVLGLLLYPYIPFVYLLSYHATYTQRGRPRHAAYQLVTYHALLGLTLWSYFEAWSTPPGSPLEDDIGERVAKGDEEHGIGLMDMLNGEAGRAGQREGLLTHQDDRRPVDSDEAGGAEGRTVMVKSTNGGKRFCRKCSVLKPDRSVRIGYLIKGRRGSSSPTRVDFRSTSRRTHHCSTCGCCVLKMVSRYIRCDVRSYCLLS